MKKEEWATRPSLRKTRVKACPFCNLFLFPYDTEEFYCGHCRFPVLKPVWVSR